MDAIGSILKNMAVAWPSIILGAIIPCGVLLYLFVSKKRKETAFRAVGYGFLTFFLTLVIIAVLLLVCAQLFLPTIAISDQSDANVYIYVGGSLALLFFYLIAEGAKHLSFKNFVKQERNLYAGLTYGCGFILAHNLLILGLIYAGEVDFSQAIVFGVLMIISGLIYLLISTIGYHLATQKQQLVGPALAISYYLLFAIMLLFANVFVTYICVVAVLIFNLIMCYILLPFKAKKGGETQ
ncbi:MAG: YhfC family intramembrane metalloprotease [Clostridia bacterium]|nr:YhfC family intramembrane metalloprotease [Clostridia bacterium]